MRFVVPSARIAGSSLAIAAALAGSQLMASPSAQEALQLQPVQQRDVDYDTPAKDQLEKCTIRVEKIGGLSGWMVRDPGGRVLRMFADTNGDNVVDQWSYFRDGIEVYRDIDSNFNGKADQSRWVNNGGTRWGIDANEDRRIDSWKTISPEELSSEIVAAIATRDAARFERLLLNADEISKLGLDEAKKAELVKKAAEAMTAFNDLLTKQKVVDAESKWVHFGGSRPATVPAGSNGATKDLMIYENVVTVLETKGQHVQLQLGTLVRAGDVWRAIDSPATLGEGDENVASTGFFFPAGPGEGTGGSGEGQGVDRASQELLSKLEEIDKAAAAATSNEAAAKLTEQKADLVEQIADAATTPEDRAQWIRQLADSIGAAAQSGTWPEGVDRLAALQKKLAEKPEDAELAAYVEFRHLTAEYGRSLSAPSADFTKIQTQWLESLRNYVKAHPTSEDTAEAMLQLAIAQEFAGQEEEARTWYDRIAKEFPKSATAQKATGAVSRLASVGNAIDVKGPNAVTGATVDLRRYSGKVVLIQYWATWCEPAIVDLAQLKELVAKYGKDGLEIVGVSLDTSKQDLLNYLNRNRLPWAQIYEPGGLDSRLANEMGILTLPTMILVDKQGRVVNRNVHITELDREVGTLLR